MNLNRRSARYGFGLHFAAGFAGVCVIAASYVAGFSPNFEIWLASLLILVLVLHVRLGFALHRAEAEIEMLERLGERVHSDKSERPRAFLGSAPQLNLADVDVRAEDATILKRVKSSIECDRIDLYLQPIVSLPQRKGRFYEAFSRLRDDTGRILMPTEYIEAAERANRIGVIDNMILLRCVQALRRHARRVPRLVFFCNLSPATLYDSEFFNQFTDYLEENSDLAASLVFEFTYPAVQLMHPRVEKNLDAIARKGFAFSVDHVASLDLDWAELRARNFCYAKAAASLLLAAGSGGEAAAGQLKTWRKRIAAAGVDLIIEKVELEGHMPEILSLGIDYGQGNLFGPVRPASFYLGEIEKNAQERELKAAS